METERERLDRLADERADAAYDAPLSEMSKGEFVMALAMVAIVMTPGPHGDEQAVMQVAERLALEFFRHA
jgi:hypothetical protein